MSAYALTVEAGTPLADDPARHPDDDVQADEYELADDLLTAAGLANYEVSNWARPGHECRHNLLYWRQQDYRGLRLRRPLPPRRAPLVEPAHAGALHRRRPRRPLDRGRRRGARRRRPAGSRASQLSLRTTAGVPVDALDGDDLPGVVERVGDRWVLTRRGRLMANDVAVRLR